MLVELNSLLGESSDQKVFLVATSGGPDSMAMLDMLSKYTTHLVVVHVNYKTRKESDDEQQMVARFAVDHGLMFEYEIANDYEKGNFQHWARQKRYQFFLKIYKKYNAQGLFVGHHMDDSIETYLWQSSRKSLYNYAGIPPKTTLWGMNVYRPLLGFDKKSLMDYCTQNHIPFSIDSSNQTNKYTRNKIRHSILEQYTSEEKKEMVKTIEWMNNQIKEEQEELNRFVSKNIKESTLELEEFNRLDETMQNRILYHYLYSYMVNPQKLSKKMLDNIRLQLMGDKPNVQIRLGDSMVLSKEYHQASVYSTQISTSFSYVIDSRKVEHVGCFLIAPSGPTNCGVAVTDEDFPLTLRNALPEDKISIKNGTKRLNRLFIDTKLPMRLRRTTPVLLNKIGEIILVVGLMKDFKRIHMQSNLFVIK